MIDDDPLQEGEGSVEARRGSRSSGPDGVTVVGDLKAKVVRYRFVAFVARLEGPESGAIKQASKPAQGLASDAKSQTLSMGTGGQRGASVALDHQPIKASRDPSGPLELDQSVPWRRAGGITSEPREHSRHERERQKETPPHPM